MAIDLTNQRFTALTAIRRVGSRRIGGGTHSVALWLCRCDCGSEIEVTTKCLRGGKRRYCDWRNHRDISRAPDQSLPQRAMRPTWGCWVAMRSRCKYPHGHGWRNYGGRGITVCERWQSFDNFLADMGQRPSPAHSIERVDVNGNYEPGNCVWATTQEQGANRRDTVWVEWRGGRRKLIELAREFGLDVGVVRARVRLGWSIERAINEPTRPKHKRPYGPPKPPSKSSIVRDLLKQGVSVDTIMSDARVSREFVHSVWFRVRHPLVPTPRHSTETP